MPQADFAYTPANDPSAALAVSIFADNANLRAQMRDDVEVAGLRIVQDGAVAALLESGPRPLGEVVLLDCPRAGGAELAALARLDERAARAGAHLVISTSVEALEDVFACCDRSNPQILVNPTRADRVIALGRALGQVPHLRLRELSDDDRLALLRLTEQVGQIAERLEKLGGGAQFPGVSGDRAFRLESPARAYRGGNGNTAEEQLARSNRPPMPDPRLVRRIIRQRQMRTRFFDGGLFADPAWDILLDLTAARVEHTRVSVTSLCIASGVPPTTALRWISQMSEAGLLERVEDETDRRRAFIVLSDKAADAMARYFAELGKGAAQLV